MFENATKIDLCQISLTGARAIALIGLLIEEPRSLEEIKQAFIEYKLMEESGSYDVIRIDINTLRTMGCEITRADSKTDGKYVLTRHPYELKFKKDEINIVKRIYRKLKEEFDIKTLLEYDKLFKKLANYIGDQEIKDQVLGISILSSKNTDMIYQLLDDCKEKKILELVYKSPNSNNASTKKVALNELVYKNDKLYLYAYDLNKQEAVTLNIDRILEILSREDDKEGRTGDFKPITIKFRLKDFGVNGLEDCESIIEIDKDEYIILGNYHNEFVAMQRILSFGSNCTILSPDKFKNQLIETLKSMKEAYNE